jgi:hypothetical protein
MKRRWGSLKANWLIMLVVFAVALASVATDSIAFMRFVPNLGLPSWAGIPCAIIVKLVEWTSLIFASRLSAKGRMGKFVCPVAVIAWCIAVALSWLAAYSAPYGALESVERNGAKNAEIRADLTGTLASITAQLVALSKPVVPRTVCYQLPRPAIRQRRAFARR